ncbi:hypothetical protein [Microlunatus ginsengisoli]|uniref:hypothetical protein n=1 Tax=Microlunatus ginsengisoli TaxID=363863 RepID=UPI0031D9CB43
MTSNQSEPKRRVKIARDPLGMINSEGMITGTVVSAAAIAASAGHFEETRLLVTVFGTAFIYWLAHVHARTLGDAVKHHKHPMAALSESVAETWPILAAAVVPAVILVLVQLMGGTVLTAAWCAVIACMVLLTVYSFVAARRGGLGTAQSIGSAAIGAFLGLLIIALKAGLH